MAWWKMKPTAKWWNKSLQTPAPNRKTPPHVTSNAHQHWRHNGSCAVHREALICSCVCVWCRDSCQRGWRLLYILTAFHRCSDVMKPFLLKFLQDACASPGVQYQGMETIHPSIHPSLSGKVATAHQQPNGSVISDVIVDWLLFLLDRYCQGMWAESEEDFSVWRTCTVSEQHGT